MGSAVGRSTREKRPAKARKGEERWVAALPRERRRTANGGRQMADGAGEGGRWRDAHRLLGGLLRKPPHDHDVDRIVLASPTTDDCAVGAAFGGMLKGTLRSWGASPAPVECFAAPPVSAAHLVCAPHRRDPPSPQGSQTRCNDRRAHLRPVRHFLRLLACQHCT